MSAEPSPRPWRVNAKPSPVGDGYNIRDEYDNVPAIARTYNDHDGKTARLIVRAVNAHDDLVGALAKCVDHIDGQYGAPPNRLAHDLLTSARAALAKATEWDA